ncbi:hypothetical protein BHM03_00026005 [Ensete ventricosum]|nr:hypothetical protein BHM03_00026005 [Ensete ventricosum]
MVTQPFEVPSEGSTSPPHITSSLEGTSEGSKSPSEATPKGSHRDPSRNRYLSVNSRCLHSVVVASTNIKLTERASSIYTQQPLIYVGTMEIVTTRQLAQLHTVVIGRQANARTPAGKKTQDN